jgi:hypothetical protein
MKKNLPSEIKKYALNTALHQLHKEDLVQSDFGMDNTTELIDGGFALYSTVNTKKNIGPIKTAYYRIAVVLSGTATFTIGLETLLFLDFPDNCFLFKTCQRIF